MPSAFHHCVSDRRSAEETPAAARQCAEYRGGMKPGLVHAFRRRETQPAHHFATDGDTARKIAARQRMPLRGGGDRRDDHRAGVHRAAFERVVEIFAVRRRAVAQRRGGDIEAAAMADQRARTRFRGRAQCGLHVIAAAGGDTQARDIHQHRVAHLHDGGWKRRRHGAEGGRQPLRDGHLRKGHTQLPITYSASILLARATAV